MKLTHCCIRCGCTDIEELQWHKVNAIVDSYVGTETDRPDNVYCPKCDKCYDTYVTIEEFHRNKHKENEQD